MVDIELVIKQYLNTAGTPFKTLVGSNIFIDRAQSFNGATSKGCVFRIRDGSNNEYLPIHTPIVEFRCFGGTESFQDCKTVYRALHDILHAANNKAVDSGVIIQSHEIISGQNLVDPDTDWLFTLVTYQIDIRGL